MNCNSTWIRLREVSFTCAQKIVDDIIRWVRSIYKEKLIMLNSLWEELATVVLCLIQSNYSLDVPLLENFTVLIWGKTRSLSWLSSVNRAHKGSELSWDDPIDVPIVNSLIIFVLFDIECLEIVPSVLDPLFQTLQTVQDSALIVTVALGGIAERHKLSMIGAECVKGLLGRNLQDYDHESTHQKGCVWELVWPIGAVMEDPVVLVLIILNAELSSSF